MGRQWLRRQALRSCAVVDVDPPFPAFIVCLATSLVEEGTFPVYGLESSAGTSSHKIRRPSAVFMGERKVGSEGDLEAHFTEVPFPTCYVCCVDCPVRKPGTQLGSASCVWGLSAVQPLGAHLPTGPGKPSSGGSQ